ncbi:MAG: radical SAM protein [Candidatus Bathyarchaeota archaeon]|nr:radical SAM protein [Candidatus Bathyarchaeota archaeon]
MMDFSHLENVVFTVTINPLIKHIIGVFDWECPEDGNLLLNSLREFLGEPIELCPSCRRISRNIARPFYETGSLLLRVDKEFMKRQFLKDRYGDAWFKGFGLMMKGIEKYGIRVPFVPAGPFEIVWNLTYKCNLRCKHCYENAGNSGKFELSTGEAKQAIDILADIAHVGLPALSFSGGEPLARKDLFELAAYAKKKIPYISVASNGTLITRDNAKKLKDAGVDYVEISIDGASSQTHDEFRGIVGAFEKAIEGVKNCVEEGIDTCIATVLHRDNLKETEKILQLAKDLNVRFMHFNFVPTGRARKYMEMDLTPDQRHHVLQTIGKEIISLYLLAKEEEMKTGRTSIKVDRFFSTCPQYAPVTKQLSEQRGHRFIVEAHYAAKKGVENVANFLGGCGAGRLYCAIEPDGKIKPCVFLPTAEDTVIGNILEDDFEEIWDSHPLLWQLRRREDLETYIVDSRIVGCGGCVNKYICGGCRARAYSYFNGNIKSPDIGCIRNKPIWEKLLTSSSYSTAFFSRREN